MNDSTKAKLVAIKDKIVLALKKPTTYVTVAIVAAAVFVLTLFI